MVTDEELAVVARKILETGKVVAFSGAGVSAESEIPTFRDPGGLWDRMPEAEGRGLTSVIGSDPGKAVDILTELFETFKKAKPNPGHYALAELERMGLLESVITQNIDNLHREVGNSTVYELHGTVYRLRCLSCDNRIPLAREEFLANFGRLIDAMRKGAPPEAGAQCPECGGPTRPDYVDFGEPVQQLFEASEAAHSCRMMLVLGTSGVVYPAAALPGQAKSRGAIIVEINPKRSELTHLADHFLQGPSGEVLPQLVDKVKELQEVA